MKSVSFVLLALFLIGCSAQCDLEEYESNQEAALSSRLGRADGWQGICKPGYAVVPIKSYTGSRYSGQTVTVGCIPCCVLGCADDACGTAEMYPVDEVGEIQDFVVYGSKFGCTECAAGKPTSIATAEREVYMGPNIILDEPEESTTFEEVDIMGCEGATYGEETAPEDPVVEKPPSSVEEEEEQSGEEEPPVEEEPKPAEPAPPVETSDTKDVIDEVVDKVKEELSAISAASSTTTLAGAGMMLVIVQLLF